MTCEELIEYLSGFAPTENVGALIVNLNTRTAYKVSAYQLMENPDNFPVMLFELGEAEPIDDVVEPVD